MTSFYLGLALLIAVTVNHRRAGVRMAGTLAAAIALSFMAASIVLANLDGTFAAVPAGNRTPLWLNIEAGLLVIAAGLLFWSAPRQWRRVSIDPLPLHGTTVSHGRITRTLHWAGAVLFIAAFVMGQFIGVLTPAMPERAQFLATHMAIGGAIFLLTFARMIERLLKPAPAAGGIASIGHFGLYALITAFCVSGLALADAPVDLLGLKLPNLPADPFAEPLHRRILPPLFALLFAAHLAGGIRHIRRMAR